MRTVALVPARGGSKGLPGKNLAEVGGATLVARAVDVAAAVRRIDATFVSSDDDRILDEACRAGAHPHRRPDDLATDTTATIDVVRNFLEDDTDADLVVLLQPTSPLRSAEDVDRCLDAADAAPTVVTVVESAHPIEWSFRLRNSMLDPVFGWHGITARRQDATPTYRLNGAVYVLSADHIRSGGELIAPGTVGIVMPAERSLDIDDPLDLAVARMLVGEVSGG